MKISVIYATKTGTTASAAKLLKDKLGALGAEVTLCDLSAGDAQISGCDAVCVGGYIRIGLMAKPVREWLSKHAAELKTVPYGIFCCRCGSAPLEPALSEALTPKTDPSIMANAKALGSFGGEMDMAKQKGLDRLVAKMVSKMDASKTNMSSAGIDEAAIADFAEKMAAL